MVSGCPNDPIRFVADFWMDSWNVWTTLCLWWLSHFSGSSTGIYHLQIFSLNFHARLFHRKRKSLDSLKWGEKTWLIGTFRNHNRPTNYFESKWLRRVCSRQFPRLSGEEGRRAPVPVWVIQPIQAIVADWSDWQTATEFSFVRAANISLGRWWEFDGSKYLCWRA